MIRIYWWSAGRKRRSLRHAQEVSAGPYEVRVRYVLVLGAALALARTLGVEAMPRVFRVPVFSGDRDAEAIFRDRPRPRF